MTAATGFACFEEIKDSEKDDYRTCDERHQCWALIDYEFWHSEKNVDDGLSPVVDPDAQTPEGTARAAVVFADSAEIYHPDELHESSNYDCRHCIPRRVRIVISSRHKPPSTNAQRQHGDKSPNSNYYPIVSEEAGHSRAFLFLRRRCSLRVGQCRRRNGRHVQFSSSTLFQYPALASLLRLK